MTLSHLAPQTGVELRAAHDALEQYVQNLEESVEEDEERGQLPKDLHGCTARDYLEAARDMMERYDALVSQFA